MAPVLALEIAALSNVPLCEDKGETYHRDTHNALIKGSASSTAAIMASTRRKQSLKTCKQFVKQNGKRGKQVFRFEWLRFKRGLRCKPSGQRQWQPLKVADREFFERWYKLEPDVDDWQRVINASRAPLEPAVPRHTTNLVRQDWARTVFGRGDFFQSPCRKKSLPRMAPCRPFPRIPFSRSLRLHKTAY